MNTRKLVLALSILAVVLFAAGFLTLAQTGSKASVVAAITKIENDGGRQAGGTSDSQHFPPLHGVWVAHHRT
jgi:hypothetical protein